MSQNSLSFALIQFHSFPRVPVLLSTSVIYPKAVKFLLLNLRETARSAKMLVKPVLHWNTVTLQKLLIWNKVTRRNCTLLQSECNSVALHLNSVSFRCKNTACRGTKVEVTYGLYYMESQGRPTSDGITTVQVQKHTFINDEVTVLSTDPSSNSIFLSWKIFSSLRNSDSSKHFLIRRDVSLELQHFKTSQT